LIYPVDHGSYGYILANRGELQAGLRELEIAERGLPDHPRLNYDIGRILLILQRPQEALERFEREIRAAPANPNPYRRAGQAARQAGDGLRAVGHLERYLTLTPGGAQADAVRREIAALRKGPPPMDGGKTP
jgi:tetratricopeptide (TPR) repeat protein